MSGSDSASQAVVVKLTEEVALLDRTAFVTRGCCTQHTRCWAGSAA